MKFQCSSIQKLLHQMRKRGKILEYSKDQKVFSIPTFFQYLTSQTVILRHVVLCIIHFSLPTCSMHELCVRHSASWSFRTSFKMWVKDLHGPSYFLMHLVQKRLATINIYVISFSCTLNLNQYLFLMLLETDVLHVYPYQLQCLNIGLEVLRYIYMEEEQP